MPYHTVLGQHELFVVRSVHHAKVPCWTEERRFLAMFIFRAHCKCELFQEVQLPHLSKESFWEDPASHFELKADLWKSMLEYRQRTRSPLITAAFRCIPHRLREDDDENLVHDIAVRTQTLLTVAKNVWPILNDTSKSVSVKFNEISSELKKGKGLGETWAKMLMVCIDIANPRIGLLLHNCEVGVGAEGGLQRLLPSYTDAKSALVKLTSSANRAQLPSVRFFWDLLRQVEKSAQAKYQDFPLVLAQTSTPMFGLSAVTVQVQLCEWRQFHAFLGRVRAKNVVSAKSGPKKKNSKNDEEDEEDNVLLGEMSDVKAAAPVAAGSKRPPAEASVVSAKRQCTHGQAALTQFKEALQNAVSKNAIEDGNAVPAALAATTTCEDLQAEAARASLRLQEKKEEVDREAGLLKLAENALESAQEKKQSASWEHSKQVVALQSLQAVSQEDCRDKPAKMQLQLLLHSAWGRLKPTPEALIAILNSEDGHSPDFRESVSASLQSALKAMFAELEVEIKSQSARELSTRSALHGATTACDKAASCLDTSLDRYSEALGTFQHAQLHKHRSLENLEKQAAIVQGLQTASKLAEIKTRGLMETQRMLQRQGTA